MPETFATLLLTRPRAESERLATQLRDVDISGIRILIAPLIEIVPTGTSVDLGEFRGVIFTSANGVRFAGPGRGMAAFCVGPATCAAAAAAGWKAQLSGATSDELVATLLAGRPAGPLLHVSGIHKRGNVARRLTEAGFDTREADVYEQRQLPLAREAQDALAAEQPVIVPVFSPRTARQFVSLARPTAPLHLVAISETVMAELSGLPAMTRHVAAEPNVRRMIDAIAKILRRVVADHAPK